MDTFVDSTLNPEDLPVRPEGSRPDAATGKSPPVSVREAERLVLQHYGFEGRAERIAGERDENFCIRGQDGTAIFLKVAHAHEDGIVTNMATAVLLHLADRAPEIPVQRVRPTLRGQMELETVSADGSGRKARVTTYLDGELLRGVTTGRDLRLELGRTLAQLNRTLRTFEHPGLDHQHLLWDVQRSEELRRLVDPGRRDHGPLLQWLDHFEVEIRPRMMRLRAQPVHNDFSRDNLLIDETGKRITGILDFGDLVHAPLINDVAIAAYQLWDPRDPLESAADLVAGYNEVDRLQEEEVALLHDLMMMRIVWRIVISEWRAERFPENRDYILRNTSLAWSEFETLAHLSKERTTEQMMHALTTGKVQSK